MQVRLKQASGFSLIELMVTISIMSTLVTLSLPTVNRLALNSAETEGQMNSRHLAQLLVGYYSDENDRLAGGATFGYGVASFNNYSSSTSCNSGNGFGFKLQNCAKIKYFYMYIYSGTAGTVQAAAFEGGQTGDKRLFKKCTGSSIWLSRPTTSYHTVSPNVSAECLTLFNTKVLSQVGGSDNGFDFNGDGVVAAGDSLVVSWLNSVPAVIIGGTKPTHLFAPPP